MRSTPRIVAVFSVISSICDFGNAVINTGSATDTFTIVNTGSADLNLTGTPKVAISGANAADFTVITQDPRRYRPRFLRIPLG